MFYELYLWLIYVCFLDPDSTVGSFILMVKPQLKLFKCII